MEHLLLLETKRSKYFLDYDNEVVWRYSKSTNKLTKKTICYTQEGYAYISVDDKKGGLVYLHRGAVQADKDMVVHHKDGNHKNNHPDNLEVMTAKSHRQLHSKQREWGGMKLPFGVHKVKEKVAGKEAYFKASIWNNTLSKKITSSTIKVKKGVWEPLALLALFVDDYLLLHNEPEANASWYNTSRKIKKIRVWVENNQQNLSSVTSGLEYVLWCMAVDTLHNNGKSANLEYVLQAFNQEIRKYKQTLNQKEKK
jgi:hypothetical protein